MDGGAQSSVLDVNMRRQLDLSGQPKDRFAARRVQELSCHFPDKSYRIQGASETIFQSGIIVEFCPFLSILRATCALSRSA